jgi:hypothetical protein
MPKYFFSYRTGDHLARNLEGTELPSLTAAGEMAFGSARELLANAVKVGRRPPDAVILTTEDGHDLMTISLSEVLTELLEKQVAHS